MGGPTKESKPHSNILNLSLTFSLSEVEEKVLERGLFFIPTPEGVEKEGLQRDLFRYHRKLMLLDHFDYDVNPNRESFVGPSTWVPEWGSLSKPIQDLIRADRRELQNLSWERERQSNMSVAERRALQRLQSNSDIVIKPADKGSKIVVMDKHQYITEAYRQLKNRKHYLPLSGSLQLENQERIRKIVNNLYEQKMITAKQRYYLYGDDPPRSRRFYLLPKIHKNPDTWTVPNIIPPGRPIVSDCGSESYKIAEFIDHFLNPISQKHTSYIKDTYDFVTKIKEIRLPSAAVLFTIDIDSLYTSIDTVAGLKAVREAFNRYPDPSRPDEAVLELLELSLTKNDFEFNNEWYLQVHGTAMGKRFAPAYANIYMADWERTVFPKCNKLPLVYLRFLDDIFGVWQDSEVEFLTFISVLNSHHTAISVKHNFQREKIEFLDTEVYITSEINRERTLGTRVYFKPTDTHALLHKSSYHPRHTFRGIVKSQILRFYRICTEQKDVEVAVKILFQALRRRGYARTFLRNIKAEVQDLWQQGPETRKEKKNDHLLPMISVFSPMAKAMNVKIKSNFKKAQDSVEALREFKIIAAYRRNKNLKDSLVHAALPSKGIKKDKYREHFKSAKFIYNKNTHLGAPVWLVSGPKSTNVVYCIECKVCGNLYIGQTKNSLLERLKQHLHSITSTNKKTYLYEHFRLHGITNLLIMGLESGSWWSDRFRRRKESQWIRTLKTVHPLGLNQTS